MSCPWTLFGGIVTWPVDYFLDTLQAFFKKPGVNAYLQGNFAPVRAEVSSKHLHVEGAIPQDLSGEFVRNGPNPIHIPKGGYHWFDGLGMLHGVRLLPDGTVNYFNRYIRNNHFQYEQKLHRPLYIRLGEMWGIVGLIKILWQSFKTLLRFVKLEGTSNTSVVFHHGKLLALVESALPWVVQIANDGEFITKRQYSFGGDWKHPMTAHPKLDAESGEMIMFGYRLQKKPHCVVGVVDRNGRVTHQFDARVPHPVMMHDMAMTKNYSIILDMPLQLNPKALVDGKSFLQFNPSEPTRIHIFPRHAKSADEGHVFHFPAGFGFHTVNAWEEGKDEIVLLTCFANEFVMEQTGEGSAEAWNETRFPTIYVFRMNLATKQSSHRQVFSTPCEFPVVNPHHLGRRTRFAFVAGVDIPSNHNSNSKNNGAFRFSSVIKLDLGPCHAGNSERLVEVGRVTYGAGLYAGECQFVPRRGAKTEDDGYLLTFVYDEKRDASEFWVLNAKTMDSKPIAKVLLPQRVPYGFHGIFVGEEELQTQEAF